MSEEKLEPEIRFKGFEDKWKEVSFKQLGTIAMCKRIYKDETNKNYEIPFYKIGTFGKEADTYISEETYEEYKELYPFPSKGDVLISAAGTIGRTVVYDGTPSYFQDSNIIWLDHEEERVLNEYLEHYYKIVEWDGIEGTTIKRLYNDIFLNSKVYHPSIEEQKLIAKMLTNISDVIEQKQKEINRFLKFKKAMLQKMFPKEGEIVPEVRFDGFEGEWEENNLGSILNINSGRDYKHLTKGIIPVYGTGGYMLSVNEALSHQDAIGIGRKGTIDIPQKLIAPFWTVDTLFYMTPIKNDDLNFLFHTMETINWREYDESTGVPSLSKKQIYYIKILMPSLSEQQKIGNYFNKLDNNIQSKQAELDKLKQFKQAMLDKMFV